MILICCCDGGDVREFEDGVECECEGEEAYSEMLIYSGIGRGGGSSASAVLWLIPGGGTPAVALGSG